MDNGTKEKRESKALMEGIKKLAADPKDLGGHSYDKYSEDLSIKGNATTKNINDFTSKKKGRTENKKDIFSDILETVDGFLGSDDSAGSANQPAQSKVLRYTKQAAGKSLGSARQLIIDQVKKGFFSSEGGCDSDAEAGDTYYISPTEFDFINMLKVNPESTSGKVMYETQPGNGLGVQFNRELYTAFGGTPYDFDLGNGSTLFSTTWDAPSQKYAVTVPSGTNVSDFIDDYYNSIEQSNIGDVLQNSMMGVLQGDGSEGSAFNKGMDSLNRLLTNCFGACDSSSGNGGESPFLNNATSQIKEDETGTKEYFDFDNVEGIDLDDEDARKRRVLKFIDCNNFEIPINPNHMEDFAYLLDSKNIDENVSDTLNKAAVDAYEQSDGSISQDGFNLSLNTDFITQIPRALVSSVLSPKMIFPIALSYYMLHGVIKDVKDLMVELSNMFYDLIKDLFWIFIKEFWKLIKRDLLNFVKLTAARIILNKFKKI